MTATQLENGRWMTAVTDTTDPRRGNVGEAFRKADLHPQNPSYAQKLHAQAPPRGTAMWGYKQGDTWPFCLRSISKSMIFFSAKRFICAVYSQ